MVVPSKTISKHSRVRCRARRTTIPLPLGVIQRVYAAGVQNLVAAVYVSIMGKGLMRDVCCQPLPFTVDVAT